MRQLRLLNLIDRSRGKYDTCEIVHQTRFILAVIVSGTLSSMTDWLCAGDWVHKRFTYPEIWREVAETKAVLISCLFPFVTCAAFITLAVWIDAHSLASLLKLALLSWIMGPLPLISVNAAFIKFHRVFVVLYAAGWLLKLVIAAAVVHWLLP